MPGPKSSFSTMSGVAQPPDRSTAIWYSLSAAASMVEGSVGAFGVPTVGARKLPLRSPCTSNWAVVKPETARFMPRLPVKEPVTREPTPLDRVLAALVALNPDEMSPREALEAIYRLKRDLPPKS